MDTLVDYTNPVLDQYRHYTHDAILIYGFIPEKSSSGAIKARFTIEDGIRSVNSNGGEMIEVKIFLSEWGEWSGSCSVTCGPGIETRSRICLFNDASNEESLVDERSCQVKECKLFEHSTRHILIFTIVTTSQ